MLPERRTPDWYAAAMLDEALHGGRAGRIYRRLVLEKQIALELSGGIHGGDLFGYNGPAQMVTQHHAQAGSECGGDSGEL